jgi:hypothetical protein
MRSASRNLTFGLISLLAVVVVAWMGSGEVACADEPDLLPFDVKEEPVFKELTSAFCWFHPRFAPLPGHGKLGRPAVVMTIQKHLSADDHYSGMYYLRTDDLAGTLARA